MGKDLFECSFEVVASGLEKLVNVSFGPSFVEFDLIFVQILHEVIDFEHFLI